MVNNYNFSDVYGAMNHTQQVASKANRDDEHLRGTFTLDEPTVVHSSVNIRKK